MLPRMNRLKVRFEDGNHITLSSQKKIKMNFPRTTAKCWMKRPSINDIVNELRALQIRQQQLTDHLQERHILDEERRRTRNQEPATTTSDSARAAPPHSISRRNPPTNARTLLRWDDIRQYSEGDRVRITNNRPSPEQETDRCSWGAPTLRQEQEH